MLNNVAYVAKLYVGFLCNECKHKLVIHFSIKFP